MNYVGNKTSLDTLAELIDRDGYVVVERLAPELVADAKAQLDVHIEATPYGGYDFGGPFCGFVYGDDPHRLIEDVAQSERCHSYPDLDETSKQLPRLRFGDIEPVPTPE